MTSAQMLLGESGRRPRLWVQRGDMVAGPYPFATVLRMIREGRIPEEQPVSADQKTWTPAAKVRDLFQMERDGVLHAAESTQQFVAEERNRLETRLRSVRLGILLFHPLFLTLIGTTMWGVGLYQVWNFLGLNTLTSFFHSNVVLFLASSMPLALIIWGLTNSFGDGLLRLILRFNPAERRFLALHGSEEAFLGLGGTEHAVRTWLARGEWLAPPRDAGAMGYLHIFRTGTPVRDMETEVHLWDELQRSLPPSLRGLCRPGPALREVQDVHSLPAWSRVLNGITDGASLGNILNAPYHVWMDKFLRRARRKLHLHPEAIVDFYLYSFQRITGESVLAAAVFPRPMEDSDSEFEVPSAAA